MPSVCQCRPCLPVWTAVTHRSIGTDCRLLLSLSCKATVSSRPWGCHDQCWSGLMLGHQTSVLDSCRAQVYLKSLHVNDSLVLHRNIQQQAVKLPWTVLQCAWELCHCLSCWNARQMSLKWLQTAALPVLQTDSEQQAMKVALNRAAVQWWWAFKL